ncbi:SH3 domain-containing protein [Coralliovum pocilloporae]|uniref:SH3 domain-containing protein n=1 Tax=Coralliovum pocilloporae TaxID=3066369 RepID=UPI0033078B93
MPGYMKTLPVTGTLLAIGLVISGGLLSAPAYAYPAEAVTALNVRTGPGVKHKRISTLARYETVDVRKCTSTGWCKISFRGKSGWVSKRYLVNAREVLPPVIVRPEPNVLIIEPEPEIVIIEPEPEILIVEPEPEVVIIDENEGIAVIDGPDGTAIIDEKEGITVIDGPDGSAIIDEREGIAVFENEDGTVLVDENEGVAVIDDGTDLVIIED